MYCIHIDEPHDVKDIDSFLIPEAKDDKLSFIQEVARVTACEVLVNLKVYVDEYDYTLYPIGYYKHCGPRHIFNGEWVYKMRKWRDYISQI